MTTNTFTVAHASATTSGNVTLNRRLILGSANVHSVTFASVGRYWVNFIVPMPDNFYTQIQNPVYVIGILGAFYEPTQPRTIYGCSVVVVNTGGSPVSVQFDIAIHY